MLANIGGSVEIDYRHTTEMLINDEASASRMHRITSNHSDVFSVDEDALISGAALYMRYALDYLSGR